jgi:hypothetical protein
MEAVKVISSTSLAMRDVSMAQAGDAVKGSGLDVHDGEGVLPSRLVPEVERVQPDFHTATH